jgi:ATP-binding protein involved in chromosome partitioning
MTGRPLLDPATVPIDVAPLRIALVGAYAVRIDWSDGHSTGIYTYEYLRSLCPCERCRGT